jgi:hypothetical protein
MKRGASCAAQVRANNGYTSRLGWAPVQPFSFIPSDLSHAPFKAHGAASGAVGGDAVALTVPVAPHRLCPMLDAS